MEKALYTGVGLLGVQALQHLSSEQDYVGAAGLALKSYGLLRLPKVLSVNVAPPSCLGYEKEQRRTRADSYPLGIMHPFENAPTAPYPHNLYLNAWLTVLGTALVVDRYSRGMNTERVSMALQLVGGLGALGQLVPQRKQHTDMDLLRALME